MHSLFGEAKNQISNYLAKISYIDRSFDCLTLYQLTTLLGLFYSFDLRSKSIFLWEYYPGSTALNVKPRNVFL